MYIIQKAEKVPYIFLKSYFKIFLNKIKITNYDRLVLRAVKSVGQSAAEVKYAIMKFSKKY